MGESCSDVTRIDKELSFLHPSFWTSEKVCGFYRDADDKEKGVTILPSERSKQSVESDWRNVLKGKICSTNLNVPSYCKSYGQIFYYVSRIDKTKFFKTTHFDILFWDYSSYTQDEEKIVVATRNKYFEQKFKDPLELRRFIRNKYQHFKEMPKEFQEVLGWADENGNLDKHKFSKYWTSLFPCHLPFLWPHFYQAHKQESLRLEQKSSPQIPTLERYFPKLQVNQYSLLDPGRSPIDPNGVLRNLNKTFITDLEKGGVTGRFKIGTKKLEYRTLDSDAVRAILDTKKILKVEISFEGMSCSWYNDSSTSWPTDTTWAGIVAGQKTKTKKECHSFFGEQKDDDNTVIIIGNTINDVNKILAGVIKSGSGAKKVIVFSGCSGRQEFEREKEEMVRELEALKQACGVPCREEAVSWKDLSLPVQESLVDSAKVRIQGEEVNLKDLLPKSSGERERVMSCLEGDLLTQLLRKQIPHLLQPIKIPVSPKIYFRRYISKRVKIHKKKLEDAPSSELFVIVSNKSTRKKLKCFPEKMVAAVEITDSSVNFSLTADVKILAVAEEVNWGLSKIAEEVEKKEFGRKHIHWICHMNGNLFEWMASVGSTSFIEKSCPNTSIQSSCFSEDDFLDNVKSDWEQRRLVVIADSAGNGKTDFLLNQARKSEASGNYFTFYFNMTYLLETAVAEDVNVGTAFTEIATFNKFEKALCSHWLHCTDENEKECLKFKVFVDALDEVKVKDRTRALDILRRLQNFPSVSVVITLREHILEEFYEYFENSQLFKLEPFPLAVQAEYHTTNWLREAERESVGVPHDGLQEFALKCVINPLNEDDRENTGTPLICSLLTEEFKQQALSGDFELRLENYSITRLYDLRLERQFENWLRRQKQYCCTKGTPVFATMRRETLNWHIYLAIKLLFSEEQANKFISVLVPSAESWKEMMATVLDQGMVTSLIPVTFLHQTFPEDIVAQFILAVMGRQFSGLLPEHPDFVPFISEQVLAVNKKNELEHPSLCFFITQRSKDLEDQRPGNVWFTWIFSVMVLNKLLPMPINQN